MSKTFEDRRMIDRIIEDAWEKGMTEAFKIPPDPTYTAYIVFCTLGGKLLQEKGMDEFKKYVAEIIEKNPGYTE